jgi:TRAP-type C4-dicarboxylate transport system permease large subunit
VAAGVAAVYLLAVTMFIYRDIGWCDLWLVRPVASRSRPSS